MAKYWDNDKNVTYTEEDIQRLWNQHNLETGSQIPFQEWLRQNINIEKCADEWKINSLRKNVAKDIATNDLPYETVLNWMTKHGIFENWTDYEIDHRPIDVDEIAEIIEHQTGIW